VPNWREENFVVFQRVKRNWFEAAERDSPNIDHGKKHAQFLCIFFVRNRRIARPRPGLDIAPTAGQVSAMTVNQTQTVEAVIVGAGMAGLTLAHALAGAGIEVAVVDRADPANFTDAAFDGRTTAIATGSANVLEGIGLWSDLAPKSCPIDTIRVSDGDALMFLHFDHQEVGDEPLGYILENRDIRGPLLAGAAVRTDGIVVDAGPFSKATTTLRLTNDADLPAEMIIELPQEDGLRSSRTLIRKDVAPNSVEVIDLEITTPEPTAVEALPALKAQWKVAYRIPDEVNPVEISGEHRIFVDAAFAVDPALLHDSGVHRHVAFGQFGCRGLLGMVGSAENTSLTPVLRTRRQDRRAHRERRAGKRVSRLGNQLGHLQRVQLD